MNKEMEIFHQYLKEKKLKRTFQRDIILETFLKTERHITPEDLYNILRKKHPGIGLSTIYRTLKIFTECELAREMRRSDGTSIFEHKYDHPHHDHLVCKKCGKYFEFYNEIIEELQKKISKEHKFMMTGHRLEIYGICSKCQEKENK